MVYKAVIEARNLAERQTETLREALIKKEKDRFDCDALRILKMKKECKSLKDPDEFARYIAEQLRRAYKNGADDVRYTIRNVLQID